jgi:predicted esterase
MKRLAYFLFVLLLVFVMATCSEDTAVSPTPTFPPHTVTSMPTSSSMENSIKLGDKIEDMLITTVDQFNWDITLDSYCDFENEKEIAADVFEIECQAPPGAAVFLNCQGINGDSVETLDTKWEKLSTEIFINDRQLDLPTFGSIDVQKENEPLSRMWNMVVENLVIGTHSVRCIVDSPYYAWDATFTFTIPETIGPGDNIGAMTLEQGAVNTTYPSIWHFCEFPIEGTKPGTYIKDCVVQPMPRLVIMTGWGAKESMLIHNWDVMDWEIYIDDFKVNLEEINWYEGECSGMGPDCKSRTWPLYLDDLPLGNHTFRWIWSTEVPVDDGYMVFQPGIYEYVINFKVAEPEFYPSISSTITAGEHRLSSEGAGLKYLLHVPEDYGTDPQKQWPLLMYLHGTMPGSDLDSLQRISNVGDIVQQSGSHFIIVAPRGEGQHEFWATGEMLRSLDSLLEEIQTTLSVDSRRIYIIGYSAGGNGTWALGLRYPDRFAALAPAAGYYGWPFTVSENICNLKDVPVWVFHGAKDDVVPLSAAQMLVDALEACSGNVQFTVFPDAGHEISEQVYSNPDLYDWLLSKSLE